MPLIFDFKHEEAALDARKIKLDEFFKTQNPGLSFVDIANGSGSKEFKDI